MCQSFLYCTALSQSVWGYLSIYLFTKGASPPTHFSLLLSHCLLLSLLKSFTDFLTFQLFQPKKKNIKKKNLVIGLNQCWNARFSQWQKVKQKTAFFKYCLVKKSLCIFPTAKNLFHLRQWKIGCYASQERNNGHTMYPLEISRQEGGKKLICPNSDSLLIDWLVMFSLYKQMQTILKC